MENEITYERNLTGSYMKVSQKLSEEEECLEEKILAACKIPGLLEMRTCLAEGQKQTWFAISGKQALDTFCDRCPVGVDFLEQLIISVCRQIEILESYLMDTDCLCLRQDMIYLSNVDREPVFVLLLQERRDLSLQFRELMEYLLTKVDHGDQAAVHAAYRLYEKTLEEGYSISDIRNTMLAVSKERKQPLPPPEEMLPVETFSKTREPEAAEEPMQAQLPDISRDKPNHKRKKKSLLERFLAFLDHLIGEGKDDFVFTPEESVIAVSQQQQLAVNPTVCLTTTTADRQRTLLFEGTGSLPDIRLEEEETVIGKARDCGAFIRKDTVSLYHAKVTRKDGEYYLEDLNSTNGTYLNGEALPFKEKRVLHTGDIIRFADLRYRFF